MAKPGRKPKPVELKLIQGNPGKRAIPRDIPIVREDLKTPPAWVELTQAERVVWEYAIEHAPKGLLKTLDLGVLLVWVRSFVAYNEISKQLARTTRLLKSEKGGLYHNPLVSMQKSEAAEMLRCQAEMGFTPSSRSRVSVGEQPPDKPEGWGKFKK